MIYLYPHLWPQQLHLTLITDATRRSSVDKCTMDIDLYADVEDFNSDDAVPNSEDAEPKAKSKSSENGGDDVDLYDDVIASSSAAAASEEKKDGEEAKPDVRSGDAYQRPGRKYQVNVNCLAEILKVR